MTRIAIVEDNKTIRESLVEFVHSDPECSCICASATAEEALEIIPQCKPEIVLMDIQLPKLSGIECTAQLKRLLPSLQIIMVTVYEDTERIFQALRAGACGYLLKRCTPEQLIAAIREVREGGAPMSREVARKVIASYQNPAAASGRIRGTFAARAGDSGTAGPGISEQGNRPSRGRERRDRPLAPASCL